MPTVNGSLIASLMKSYYDLVNNIGAVFRIGLNCNMSTCPAGSSCSASSLPDCARATYNGSLSAGVMIATFAATFTPGSNYTLSELSLWSDFSPIATTVPFDFSSNLIDMTGFSGSLNAGTQYTVQLQDSITYPTTI